MRSLLVTAAILMVAAPALAQEDAGLPKSPAYTKPFLTRGDRAALGGYIDLEFIADGDGSTFDQHRFVPFIYAQVSEYVHVASEIEFEHGGRVKGSGESDGEIKIEFATVDFTLADALNLRGGVVLAPLGRLNVLHDAPMLDLTERPLVNRHIIPTTLSESGLGFFGEVYPNDVVVVDYEAYLVNGFNDGAVMDGELNLRGGRGSLRRDNNNSRAFVGRLGVSPRLGTDLGVSVHTGDYDSAGRHNLTIAAFDGRYGTGPFELLGEYGMARGDFADTTGVEATAEAAGFYVEGRVHLFAGAFERFPQSVITAVGRYDYVDRNQRVEGRDMTRISVGLNFRPTEETVFKNDLLLDRTRAAGITDWGDTAVGYRFSIASYF